MSYSGVNSCLDCERLGSEYFAYLQRIKRGCDWLVWLAHHLQAQGMHVILRPCVKVAHILKDVMGFSIVVGFVVILFGGFHHP